MLQSLIVILRCKMFTSTCKHTHPIAAAPLVRRAAERMLLASIWSNTTGCNCGVSLELGRTASGVAG